MKQLILGALSILLSSCASEPIKPVDLSLVRPYAFEHEKEKPLPSPYVAKFERAGKTLAYIAVDHINLNGYTSYLDHPTLRTIRKVFDEFNPGVAIVEGINTGSELSPKSLLPKIDQCVDEGFRSDCGESFFAIDEARKRNKYFVSGEPTDQMIADQLHAQGINTEDLIGFYTVRQIPQWNRRANGKSIDYEREISQFLDRRRSRFTNPPKMDLKQFKKWYVKRVGPVKNWSNLSMSTQETAPHGGSGATFLQKISHQVNIIRDRETVRRVDEMLARFNTVVVVFGASHLLSQRPAFIAMMGEPKYFDLQSWPAKSIVYKGITKENPAMRR